MNFKTTENLKSHIIYFYINSKRVSESDFDFQRTTSLLKGMKTESVLSWTEKSRRYVSFDIL
ncbi:MAG: hypothetical protein II098_01415 [Treponema sp.]|jgi:hypothetical protein|nr:hypothetical protein [Treponema sp.]